MDIREGILCFFTAQMTTIRSPLNVGPLFISNLIRFSVRLYSPEPPETLLTVVIVFILTIELIWRQKNIYMDIQ